MCVCTTYNRHCPSCLPIMGRPGFHIPQIMEGYLRRAEASLDPPGKTWVNSTRAQRPTGTRKCVQNESFLFTLQPISSLTITEADGVSLIADPMQRSTQTSSRSLSGTPGLCRGQCPPCADPPTDPPPIQPNHYVYLALMLRETGARVGEGRVGQSSPGPLFPSDLPFRVI